MAEAPSAKPRKKLFLNGAENVKRLSRFPNKTRDPQRKRGRLSWSRKTKKNTTLRVQPNRHRS